jgi:hypothetical protein
VASPPELLPELPELEPLPEPELPPLDPPLEEPPEPELLPVVASRGPEQSQAPYPDPSDEQTCVPIVPPEHAQNDCWPGVHEVESFELPEPQAAATPMKRSARSPAVEAEPLLLPKEVRRTGSMMRSVASGQT